MKPLPENYLIIAIVALFVTSGVWYFRKMERIFADVI